MKNGSNICQKNPGPKCPEEEEEKKSRPFIFAS
jgi:hypothetical protein